MDMRAQNGELNHNPHQNTQSVGRNFLSMWSAVDQYKSQLLHYRVNKPLWNYMQSETNEDVRMYT